MRKTTILTIGLVAVTLLIAGCSKGGAGPTTASGKAPKNMSSIYFDFDSSSIKADAKSVLEGNAGWMKDHDGKDVAIEGHCDERGADEYNIALGYRRAESAKSYLISLGVNKKRLSTISYGEEKPVATCHEESCWWKNRRDEFVKK